MPQLNVEHRASDSIHVERVWRSNGTDARVMHSVTNSSWEMVIAGRDGGNSEVIIRGPETHTSRVPVPDHANAMGIVFAHGTAMPHLPAARLLNSHANAPQPSATRVTLQGDAWGLPTYEKVEDFVGHLVRAGIVRHDRLVSDVVAGADDHGLTGRSVQRRVASVTGLTQGMIRQIERSRAAALLLQQGALALDVVWQLGFYDQPHLARSLIRFIGRTATELQQPDPEVPLSLLYTNEAMTRY